MPNLHPYHLINLDHQGDLDLDLFDLDVCTECIDNINLNHEASRGAALDLDSVVDDSRSSLENINIAAKSNVTYYSKSMPKSIPSNKTLKTYGVRTSRSRTKSLNYTTDNKIPVNTNLAHSHTCSESFYTPEDTRETGAPIMSNIHSDSFYSLPGDSECPANNTNGEIGNKADLPLWSNPSLNDSDDDGDNNMFDREQVEDMSVDVELTQPDIGIGYNSNTGHAVFPDSHIVPSYSVDDQTHNLFMDAFIQNNRLDSVSQVMGYHPDYLRIFLSTQHFLLRQDGPLSYEYRHYIAIMAAARHHCTYLVEQHQQDFLLHNGNPDWLKGLDQAPRKLRDLYELNKLLAHQPWMVTKEHMVKLLKSSEPWSLSELMHAIILLTHFHALSSFVFGCGISSELNSQGGHTYTESVLTSTSPTVPPTSSIASSPVTTTTTSSDTAPGVVLPGDSESASQRGESPLCNGHKDGGRLSPPGRQGGAEGVVINGATNGNGRAAVANGHGKTLPDESGMDVEALMEKMRQLTEGSGGDASQEELIKRFHSVEKNTAEIAVPSSRKPSAKSELMKYVIDDDFCYVDFAKRKSIDEIPTFRAVDYSWEDHGFSLANRLYADIGNYLDDKYSTAASMTYYTMGDLREVDTSSFRRAIWNYIHTMYGIRHDDYDYAEVNQLLAINLKAYIKTLTCYPERLQKKDFEGVMKGFKHSEKVHVNLMLMEARQQAELLYALRALNRYLT